MGLKHSYKSLKPDPADPTLIGASKWNADHYFVDDAGVPIGNVGAILALAAAGAVTRIDSVAVGRVLASAGAAALPIWTDSPTLANLTVTGTITGGAITLTGGITITPPELGYIDGAIPGVVVASKAVVVDANRDIATFRNLTAENLLATTITASGAIAAGSIVLGGGSITIDGSELGVLDGAIPGTVVASKAVVVDANKDIASFRDVTIGRNLLFNANGSIGDGAGNSPVNVHAEGSLYVINPATGGVGAFVKMKTGASVNVFQIFARSNAMFFGIESVADYWQIAANGHWLAGTDNTYDIGAINATRPRTIYTATAIVVGTAPALTGAVRLPNSGAIYARNVGNTADYALISLDGGDTVNISANARPVVCWGTLAVGGANPATVGTIRMPSGSLITARNAANTADVPLMQFDAGNNIYIGDLTANTNSIVFRAVSTLVRWTGTTSASPALKNVGTTLQVRLGDDSAFAPIAAASYGTGIATGNLITQDMQTLANGAIISLGTDVAAGFLTVTMGSACGVFIMQGGLHAVTKVTEAGSAFSSVAGTVGSMNVYWSAANSRYEIQNNLGFPAGVFIVRLGQGR